MGRSRNTAELRPSWPLVGSLRRRYVQDTLESEPFTYHTLGMLALPKKDPTGILSLLDQKDSHAKGRTASSASSRTQVWPAPGDAHAVENIWIVCHREALLPVLPCLIFLAYCFEIFTGFSLPFFLTTSCTFSCFLCAFLRGASSEFYFLVLLYYFASLSYYFSFISFFFS